jgi:glycosyltransferase involved in cell wall biosynthesis
MTDASFEQLQGYYPDFSGLSRYNIRQGIELDQKAFQKAAHCMLASEWNRRSAISNYKIDPARISVVPCGANLDEIPLASSLNFEYSGKCRLLFLGVDWERKGGKIVLDAFRKIRTKWPDAHLHIIGCKPPGEVTDPSITVIPFLDKNDPVDRSRLDGIFRESDLLFLPTRAECAGVVFSESSAYGVPSITTDTGGVSNYVKNGVNGFTRPLNARGEDYAELICSLLTNKASMTELKKTCRRYYDENLSWDLWGRKFRELAENLLSAG